MGNSANVSPCCGGPNANDKSAESEVCPACHLRIIAVNDVYNLDNFPRLKTLVSTESAGLPPENVLTTLAGDFLAPSLLSSLDAGMGMIAVMNKVPVDIVCFGNHDGNDIPYGKLVHRIDEFQGKAWLNSNMPGFKPALPTRYVHNITSNSGKKDARSVAFLGLCIGGGNFKAVYRDSAFGGAHETMVPVLEAGTSMHATLQSELGDRLDAVIPVTHQDMPEDRELAETGLFPVIVAGHDHDLMHEVVNGCPIVKAGQDAHHAAIVDIVWSSGMQPGARPLVKVEMKAVADYEPHTELAAQVERICTPVRELESAMLYELQPEEILTSVNAKFHDVSMGRKLASAIRDCLDCDAAVINSGAVRGNKEYSDCISFGDLKKECPYPSAVVVTRMPFSVLRDGIIFSRKPWQFNEEKAPSEDRKEGNSALQGDDGIHIDEHHRMTEICHEKPTDPEDLERLYAVACDTYFLKKNEVFKKYCQQFPERIPPSDCGRPLLPILVEFFTGELWRKLVLAGVGTARSTVILAEGNASILHQFFEEMDVDHDGKITHSELKAQVDRRLGERLSSKVILDQMIQLVDSDFDGKVDEKELRAGLRKIFHSH